MPDGRAIAAAAGTMARAGRAAIAALMLACGMPAPALAHAFLDHALPAVGSTVHAPPATVRLWFSERLEPAFSKVRVLDDAGKQVDAGDSHLDPANASILTATVPALRPGKYRVAWRVVSVDTHVTEGDYTFDIAP